MRRLYNANEAILGKASDWGDQRNVLIFAATIGSSFTPLPRQIGGVADCRHREFDRKFAMRPDDASEAQPQCRRVAGERQLDGLVG
jgi:hypothetical protein